MTHYPAYAQGRLDPQAEALLTEIARSTAPPCWTLTPEQARAGFLPAAWLDAPRKLASIRDRIIPGPAGPVPVRLYRPHGQPPFAVLVFFHGGGFVLGTLDEFDPFCTFLAEGAECLVVSVDYRLAPEHKHPAALEDAAAALDWLGSHAAEVDGDPARIAVAGDSAGGNLATGAALIARDRRFPVLVHQVLISPWVDLACTESRSFGWFGEGTWLSTRSVKWYRDHYLARPEQALLPEVSPLLAPDLGRLPPTLIIDAEFDVLRTQIEVFAGRLRADGTAVQRRFYAGMLHDFVVLPGVFARAREAIGEICTTLRQAFACAARRAIDRGSPSEQARATPASRVERNPAPGPPAVVEPRGLDSGRSPVQSQGFR